jgi:hypothetical protein
MRQKLFCRKVERSKDRVNVLLRAKDVVRLLAELRRAPKALVCGFACGVSRPDVNANRGDGYALDEFDLIGLKHAEFVSCAVALWQKQRPPEERPRVQARA